VCCISGVGKAAEHVKISVSVESGRIESRSRPDNFWRDERVQDSTGPRRML
jgi:hypothetical protein